jgi:SAM-dependent methyltransferase
VAAGSPENLEFGIVRQQGMTVADVDAFLNGDSLDVIRDVMPDDPMYVYDPDLYFEAGPQALRCIRLALLAANRDRVGTILDFASGGGRVLRYLRVAFPDAEATACDTHGPSVRFCAEVLHAKPLVGNLNLDELELEGPYDLIWVGSLFTHVSSDAWSRLLTLFEAALSPGGVLVFTAYGRLQANAIRDRVDTLDLREDHLEQIVRDYDERGFGFFPDLHPELEHGDALARRSWVCSQLDRFASLKLLMYTESAWLGQDVIACAKS